MSGLVVDTHAAIWYFAKAPALSTRARDAINDAAQHGERIFLPTISLVEIIYLIEKNKLPTMTLPRLMQALNDLSSSFVTADLSASIAFMLSQIPRTIVADMPDRIIAATALHLGLPLVTRDPQIKNISAIQTIW